MQEKINKLNVRGVEIITFRRNDLEFISLTDIARYRGIIETDDVIKNWLRNKSTIEFLGLWEKINNPGFKPVEFDWFRAEAGSNHFVLSPSKWIKQTNAIGIYSRQGRGGGTYAHKDIAFEFASWISPEFKLYLIKEFQRLKEDENVRLSLDWSLQRALTKVNYRIHTDAIKEKLIPTQLTKQQINAVYADEADLLNVAVFGITAKQWREENPGLPGNLRDHAAIEQLIVLSNLESINAVLIHQSVIQRERLIQLNRIAITQMRSLLKNKSVRSLK